MAKRDRMPGNVPCHGKAKTKKHLKYFKNVFLMLTVIIDRREEKMDGIYDPFLFPLEY